MTDSSTSHHFSATPQRILARVARIAQIEPIPNADAIELATVLGFQCVVAKNDKVAVGSLVLYFGLDALLEHNEDTAFLNNKRISIRKMRGVVSEGLIAPLSWVSRFGLDPASLVEGQDLTTAMRVRQYLAKEELVSHTPVGIASHAPPDSSAFGPGILGTLIPKTDEKRIQESPSILLQMKERRNVITIKMDGCSATYAFQDGRYQIFSRNVDITELHGNKSFERYFQFSASTQLDKKLEQYCKENNVELAIQGELCSPSINGGRTGIKRLDYYVFNIWDIGARSYRSWSSVKEICAALGLQTVPVLWEGIGLSNRIAWPASSDESDSARSVSNQFVRWADQIEYSSGSLAEGLVCKTDDDLGKRLSFKVIAPRYLLLLEKKRK